MSRDFSLYLTEIMQCCDKVMEYTDGHTLESFSNDHKSADAVTRNLGIIGEAVKNLPPEFFPLRPEVDWPKIIKFHDVIAHQYYDLKLTDVWDTVYNEIGGIRIAASNVYFAFLDDEDDPPLDVEDLLNDDLWDDDE